MYLPFLIHTMLLPHLKNNLIDFVKSTSLQAEWVTSHCDGAFVLAKTGLLDDRTSTTFPGDIEECLVIDWDLDSVSKLIVNQNEADK